MGVLILLSHQNDSLILPNKLQGALFLDVKWPEHEAG